MPETIRNSPPEGSERLREIAAQLGDLLVSKQAQYGDSVGSTSEILRALYPDGIRPEDYDGLQLVVRILDKLKRVATHGLGNDLGRENPMFDIAGYGLLGVQLAERRQRDISSAGPSGSTGIAETILALDVALNGERCRGCRSLSRRELPGHPPRYACGRTNRPSVSAIVDPDAPKPSWCPGREEITQ